MIFFMAIIVGIGADAIEPLPGGGGNAGGWVGAYPGGWGISSSDASANLSGAR